MKAITNRIFNCKDEELTVVATLVASNLERDLSDFSAFSPKFNAAYLTAFDVTIAQVSDLIEPQSETLAKKLLTERYSQTIRGLIIPLNRLTGYINLSKKDLNITPTAFGTTALRKSIDANDPEGVTANFHVVLSNIRTYNAALAEQGMIDELSTGLTQACESVAADRLQQMQITSRRRGIVQNNVSLMNGLYEQISEVLSVGKALYKGIDPAKLVDYTFIDLVKNVRQSVKSAKPVPADAPIMAEK